MEPYTFVPEVKDLSVFFAMSRENITFQKISDVPAQLGTLCYKKVHQLLCMLYVEIRTFQEPTELSQCLVHLLEVKVLFKDLSDFLAHVQGFYRPLQKFFNIFVLRVLFHERLSGSVETAAFPEDQILDLHSLQ